METEKRKFQIRLLEAQLGTVPKDPEIYKAYIENKARDIQKANNNGVAEDESVNVEKIEEKGWTGFHADDDNGLFIYNYMIKGFLKTAIQVLLESGSIKKITAYKSWIDKMVFIHPRKLYFRLKEPDGVLERPLRAMTAKGPRVSLARSDYVDRGRTIDFEIELFKNSKGLNFEAIEKALEYGQYMGLGQWRSGGSGRFEWRRREERYRGE